MKTNSKMTEVGSSLSVVTLNINDINLPIKNRDWQIGYKKLILSFILLFSSRVSFCFLFIISVLIDIIYLFIHCSPGFP